MSQKTSWLKEKSQEARKKAQEWIKDHSLKFKFDIPSWKEIREGIKTAINTAKKNISKNWLKFKLTISVTLDSIKEWINSKIINPLNNKLAGSKIPGVNKLHITPLAMGGFPDTGQMFIARESGPEMVGTIGNKNAVANNTQIIQGVSEGVKNALLSVMSSGSGGGSTTQTINLVVDGETLAKVVNTYNSNQQLRYGV